MSQLFEIPLHQLTHKHDTIYTITAHAFAQIQEDYRKFPLPDDIFFPWLHGVNGRNNQQNLFFGVRRCLPPNYRGLMTLHCGDETKARLIDTVLLNQVFDDHNFRSTDSSQINLRSFDEQPARFATLCDLVLYGPRAEEIAQMVADAQKELYYSRLAGLAELRLKLGRRALVDANQIVYKTIIIQDDFTVFEEKFPELVMYDTKGLPTPYRMDLEQLEIKQMRAMTKASEITPLVWMGNTQDAPMDDSLDEDVNNPHQFSICIEAHDLADMPLPSTLTLARETLNELPDGQASSEIIHFDVYATGVSSEPAEFDVFYSRLVHLLALIEDQVQHQRRILIHCSDGYTESSLLGLSWIMFHYRITLPEAYLHLQQRRSFFVYAADLTTLSQIERRLLQNNDEPKPKRRKSMPTSDIAFQQSGHRVFQTDHYLNAVSNQSNLDDALSDCAYRQIQLSATEEDMQSHPWFYSPRFEGSFPSRVLPFLYLGNLNHATNPDMLKALNITHVIGVGEKADLSLDDFKVLYLDNLYDDGIDSIRSRLATVEDFIENARLTKGICLIHCRVGVSRSAAITICYSMKYLSCSLIEAYSFVRARRLNVIIQPNLKFMYEMLQLEQSYSGKTSITWPVLCSEVHRLNASFLDPLEAET
ncbi:Dual specificity protein phosphatase PPS1 [Choanephora cucurbitarum]|uniref:Dual specificity protein phosphatase PPS1 n=1 Tax=Choanephora cucurbitarum TaxID=101091 RepID=A0A1C7MXH8_9FUNG|nr:Dual specificity protein phosphatase PPS1 [Choanephora cucurbitarum]OBZ85699.1 Dual specificity protein phosphatase PPS1 [Choanephora cucurbitarum]